MMMVIRRIAMGIGGVVVAALLLAVAAPKAVHAIVSTLVTVANTTSNPVPTREVDNSANFPFSGDLCTGAAAFCGSIPQTITVPSQTSTGQPVRRLVVETISGVCQSTSGSSHLLAGVILLSTPPPADNSGDAFSNQVLFPALENVPGFATFGGSVRLYASPGTTLEQGDSGVSSAFHQDPSGGCIEFVTGHLVTM